MTDRDDVEEDREPPPRFCPRCRKPAPAGSRLCAECGEALADQGYCAVCERRWTQAPGEPCPKHEVALDVGPPASPRRGDGPWVTVASYPQPMAAEAARIRLDAEGIPTFLGGARMGGHTELQIATGGVRLQVPRDLAAEARVVLSQVWTPAEGDDLEDAWEDFEPEPWAARRSVMKALIVLILLLPLIQVVIVILTR